MIQLQGTIIEVHEPANECTIKFSTDDTAVFKFDQLTIVAPTGKDDKVKFILHPSVRYQWLNLTCYSSF